MKGFTKDHADAAKRVILLSGLNAIDALIEPEPAPVPVFKPGDKAYCISNKAIVTVTPTSNGKYFDIDEYRVSDGETSGWTKAANLRPLTDEDWTRTIGGVKVRAYEMNHGGFKIYYTSGCLLYPPDHPGTPIIRAALEAVGLPFMPYSESQGEFKHPK